MYDEPYGESASLEGPVELRRRIIAIEEMFGAEVCQAREAGGPNWIDQNDLWCVGTAKLFSMIWSEDADERARGIGLYLQSLEHERRIELLDAAARLQRLANGLRRFYAHGMTGEEVERLADELDTYSADAAPD